jgi:hypothetical protein
MGESHSDPHAGESRSSGSAKFGALSVALWAVAGIVLLAGQLSVALIEQPHTAAQLTYAAQRLTAVKTTQTQTDEAIEKREQQIKRASALETQYAALLTDLLEIAKVDPDARTITQKWKIQQQGQSQVQEQASKPSPEPQSTAPSKPKTSPSSAGKGNP